MSAAAHRRPAIDKQRLASDECGVIGEEEGYSVTEPIDPSKSARPARTFAPLRKSPDTGGGGRRVKLLSYVV